MHVLAPYMACAVIVGPGEDTGDFEQAKKEKYRQITVVTPQGAMLHHVLSPGKDGKERHVCLPVSSLPKVLENTAFKPSVEFLPDGKIPLSFLNRIRVFFNEVIQKKGRAVEAMIWIAWSQERGYFLHVPKQRVSHGSVHYEWSDFPAGATIVVDIHSHADFGAFFSGTDDRDDTNVIRFSGVLGHNNTKTPSHKWRFIYNTTRFDVEVGHIFEMPEMVPVAEGKAQTASKTLDKTEDSSSEEIPLAEWLEKVELIGAPGTFNGPGVHGQYVGGGSGRGSSGYTYSYQSGYTPPTHHGRSRHDFHPPAILQSRRDRKKERRLNRQHKNGTTFQAEAEFHRQVREMGSGQIHLLGDDYDGFTQDEQEMLDAALQDARDWKSHRDQSVEEEADHNLRMAIQRSNSEGLLEDADDSHGGGLLTPEQYTASMAEIAAIENRSSQNQSYLLTSEAQSQRSLGSIDAQEALDRTSGSEEDQTNDVYGSQSFETLATEYGIEAANAKKTIDIALSVLTRPDTSSLLPGLVEDIFLATPNKSKLDLFRMLFNYLPQQDQMQIQTNGL